MYIHTCEIGCNVNSVCEVQAEDDALILIWCVPTFSFLVLLLEVFDHISQNELGAQGELTIAGENAAEDRSYPSLIRVSDGCNFCVHSFDTYDHAKAKYTPPDLLVHAWETSKQFPVECQE